jgi:hypothetical protein
MGAQHAQERQANLGLRAIRPVAYERAHMCAPAACPLAPRPVTCPADLPRRADSNIEAGPSVRPARKYCDFTGLRVGCASLTQTGTSRARSLPLRTQCKYVDRRTKLRFHSKDAYPTIKAVRCAPDRHFLLRPTDRVDACSCHSTPSTPSWRSARPLRRSSETDASSVGLSVLRPRQLPMRGSGAVAVC